MVEHKKVAFGTKFHVLRREEERNLLRIAKESPDKKKRARATWLLIHYNKRLVESLARSFFSSSVEFEHEDLVAEGIISLIKAIELFDLNSPYLFSTYAGFWIKQKIQLFLNKNQLVSQGSADKEKKRVVFYDRQLISNQETKSYSLIDKLDDPDNSTAMREQFYKEENKNQINEIINSLEDSEAILIIRLYHRIMPRNLTDLYCLVSEAEKQVLREELKIKGEKISPWDLTKKKCQQSAIVKKYLKLFFDKYNLTELAKIIGKKESSVNRIKNNAFKKLQEKLKNAQQSSLKNSN